MGTFSQMTMRISTIMTQSPAVFVLRRPWMMMALACAGIAGAAQAHAAEPSGESSASPVQSLSPVVVTASGYDQSSSSGSASSGSTSTGSKARRINSWVLAPCAPITMLGRTTMPSSWPCAVSASKRLSAARLVRA